MPRTTDRTKETTTTTGTGTITLLGASSGFAAFSSTFGVGSSVMYAIVGQSTTEWEVGIGTILSSSTLSRDTVETSSNAGALVNFSAGTKDVFSTITGADSARSSIGRASFYRTSTWPQVY